MTKILLGGAAIALLIAVEMTVSGMGAQAQESRGTPAQRAACRPDVYRLCAGEIPNVRAIIRCLERNRSRLSQACSAVFAERGG